jgi:Zn-dependent M16 (insulinase) family peptidase
MITVGTIHPIADFTENMTSAQLQSQSPFTLLRSTPVASLNIEIEEYEHQPTGARHIHLAADDDQNAFMVAFRTVPQDSTGVAHILEHTSLCGSRNYPVRDPFFMMTRRSLNTFMNAFTASDWTAYPFASRNHKDFNNLLRVYLDAVFFPTLNKLDFAQEGHRVEFANPKDPNSELVFKGVVFNEMKGAMSSPVSSLWQSLSSKLFPTITYHNNSGGDPAHIPDLEYEQLRSFHAHHYHPSNALFMTYGDIPATEHQQLFHELALGEFQRKEMNIAVPDEQRYQMPQQVEDRYALDSGEETSNKSHIVLGWLLGKSIDMQQVMQAHLLSGVLLDNGASPLRLALETTDLGSAPSPLCGLQDSSREMVFACGVEGSEPERAKAVEQLVLEVLQRVAEEGVPQEMVEAVLHQLELSQREVSGDGFPYGLQLMVHALSPTLHGADPVEAIDIDPILNHLHEAIQDPEFIKGLVRELLDNPHRVRLTMQPDTNLSAELAAQEQERLTTMKAAMTDEQKQQVIDLAAALAERQAMEDDPELLPAVGLQDIPEEMTIPQGENSELAALPSTWFSRGTNGLVYQQIIVDLPELDPELAALLPLMGDLITEVGSAGRSYLETQALQAAVTGGLSANSSVRGAVDDLERSRGIFTLSGKALVRNQAALSTLLLETFESARFDELDRLRELITQERMHREQGVTNHGHSLAMAAAASALSPSAALYHHWYGLEGLKQLKALDDRLAEAAALSQLSEQLTRLRDRLLEAPRQFLLIGEQEQQETIEQQLSGIWQACPQGSLTSRFTPPPVKGTVREAWSTSTQVNFCSKAYPTVPAEHDDAAALMVLAGFLRNNFLHRTIREQGGAYGGGASLDLDSGAFRFYSYRDPRLGETLTDFDASVEWLLQNEHEWRLVEEAILGVISAIDKPGSPAGEAKKTFHATLHGRTPEQRRRFRSRILKVTEADLKSVAAKYLKPELAHIAVISDPTTLAEHPDLGLDIIQL